MKLMVLILLITQLSLLQSGKAQTTKISFKNIEKSSGLSIIHFGVTRELDDKETETLIYKMLHNSNDKIFHVKLNGKTMTLKADPDISAEYVRSFLVNAQFDYASESIIVNDAILEKEIKSHQK